MPAKTPRQHRAMEAAAHGESTLGIPKSVGKEFVAADANAKIAAGTVFVAPEGDVLLLKRAGEQGKDNFVGHWALPGGGGRPGEPEETADREATEGWAARRHRQEAADGSEGHADRDGVPHIRAAGRGQVHAAA